MTMRVYGGSEDNCDGGGDAEGQNNKKEIVPGGVKLTNTKSKKKLFQLASNSRSGNSSSTRKSSTETFLSWIPRRSRLATSKFKKEKVGSI